VPNTLRMANPIPENSNQANPPFENILKQIYFDNPQTVAKKETGKKIAEEIYKLQWSNNTDRNFFAGRAAHQAEIEKWSLGKQDMMQFLSYMGVDDATKSEANIDMTPIMIGAQFSGTLVESISKNVEYPIVKAVDNDSVDEKIERQLDALFRMKEVATITELQNLSGIQLEPTNAYVPDSEMAAKVYFEQKDQLPKEIRFQKILSKALLENQYERVLKPKLIRNNIVFNMEAVKVGRGEGRNKYLMRQGIPKNMFYNFFLNDSGSTELSYIGEAYNLKVKDIRGKFGKSAERSEGLTEQEIYDFAKDSNQNNPVSPIQFNHQFNNQNSEYQGATPYDDFSGFVIDFEIIVGEAEYWVSKKDSYGKENIVKKKGVPNPTSDSAKIIKKDTQCVYRCVYAPYAKMVIFWGKNELKDKFTWSINIPNNNGEYVPSLFERALEPMRELALIKLKKKLLIARLSPAAFAVDVESAKNVVTGNGRVYEWEDIVRIKTITGIELWSSKGLNPLESSNPAIRSASRDDTLQNIIQLDATEKSIEAGIRVLLGVPIYLDGSNVGQRTAAKLSEGQRESSSNVTGFIQNSHSQVIEESLNKICLMAWQDVVTDDPEDGNDLINTKFTTYVKMRMVDDEKLQLERDIEKWTQTPDENGMPLLTPADAYAIRQIEDITLAGEYLTEKVAENRRIAADDKDRREKSNIEAQGKSNEQAAAKAIQLQKDKLEYDKQIKELEGRNKKEEILLTEGLKIWNTLLSPQKTTSGEGGTITPVQKPQLPPQLEALLNLTFQSVQQSLTVEMNKSDEQIMQEQQEKEQMMQAAAEEQAMQEQQIQ